MKLLIFLGIGIFGTIGSWLGAAVDNGNWFGAASIALGAAGSLFGVWAGYRAGQYFDL